ncbi:MAG: RNA polymerase sigma factor [Crocinitomicaceae bacterium]|nr:RNA polymerase sigma factor [Crocinitomicaceae bacterium]
MHRQENEIDLIAKCIQRDRKACAELYALYSGWLYAVCLRYVTDKDEAKDILQDAFVLIFNNLKQYSGTHSFKGWMKKITVNTALGSFRKKNAAVLKEAKNMDDVVMIDTTLIDALNVEEITYFLSKLSPGRKQIFSAYYIEGFSHKEIAEQLGISEGTSKSQLHDAKKELKKLLELANKA